MVHPKLVDPHCFTVLICDVLVLLSPQVATEGPGPTRMNVPPSGSPRPVVAANALMLKLRRDVDELTTVWCEKSGGSSYTRNTYLRSDKS